MEMPPGFTRRWNEIENHYVHSQKTDLARCIGGILMQHELGLLRMIREMSEALELQSQHTTLTDEGYDILRKFKEWK